MLIVEVDKGKGVVELRYAISTFAPATALQILQYFNPGSYKVSVKSLGCTPERGAFLDELDGVRSRGSCYWMVYVNGRLAEAGLDRLVVNPSDVLTFKFQPVGFGRSRGGTFGKI